MPLSDLFSPLKRQFWLFVTIILIVGGGTYAALGQLPETQKTIIYFSLKPLVTQATTPTFDHAESTMKMAEAVAGWAKNPQFREDVAKEAGVTIHNFKRKLSARKQNYINVFWTLKLQDQERADRDKVVAAILQQIEKRFATLNQESSAPYGMTQPEVFSENYGIPTWALLTFTVLLSLALGILIVYARESILGRVSFIAQLQNLFPGSPLLNMPEKLGKHDEKLLERFILTFPSPRLVGTFPKSEKHFALSPTEAIEGKVDTPLLLVKLGETNLTELKNMKAIFGEDIGLIVFNQ